MSLPNDALAVRTNLLSSGMGELLQDVRTRLLWAHGTFGPCSDGSR